MMYTKSSAKSFFYLVIFIYIIGICYTADNSKEQQDERWKKKDVRDYSDADLERLYEQWEDADEDLLEPDELPEWKRPEPKIDLSEMDPNDPESMLKMSKKGKTLMMFVTVSGSPTEKETEKVSQLWQSSLFNAHYEIQRFVVGSNRVLFTLKDGSISWEVKDFLVKQDRCELVTIEGRDYPGKGSNPQKEENTTKKLDKQKNEKKPKTPTKHTEESKKEKKQSENLIQKSEKIEL